MKVEQNGNVAVKLVLSTLFLATLAACGGGSGKRNETAAPKQIVLRPANVESASVYVRPSFAEETPDTNKFDGTNVKVGVYDAGFNRDDRYDHPASIAERVKARVNNTNNIAGYHGSVVARIIAGRDLGDGFGPGLAPAADLYLASTGVITTAGSLQTDLDAFDRACVKIINNSRGVILKSESATTHSLSTVSGNPRLEATLEHIDSIDKLDADGKQQIAVYRDAVQNKGQLHIWHNGMRGRESPQVLAGAPALDPQLEAGWIAVRHVPYGPFTNPRINQCGTASNWCISVNPHGGLTNANYSAAVVTGVAAQVSQAFPWMTNSELRQTLLSSTGRDNPDADYGWGMLNKERAVQGPRRFDKRLALGDQFVANVPAGVRSTFSNQIDGDAGLLKKGDGTLSLTGRNLYTGATNIERGELEVNHLPDSPVYVGRQGTLSTDTTAWFHSLTNEGVVKVRSSDRTGDPTAPGYANVAGDFTATPNAELHLAPGAALGVSGTAKIDGSVLRLSDLAGETLGQARPIIYAGNVQGEFKEILSQAPRVLLDVTPEYSTKTASITVTRRDITAVAEQHFDGDTSRMASAAALESGLEAFDASEDPGASMGSSLLLDSSASTVTGEFKLNAVKLLSAESTSQVAASLDSTSGQIHASSQALTFQQSQAMNRALSDRLDSVSQSGGTTGAWAQAVGATGKLSQSGFATGSTNTFGGQIGLDHRIAEHSVVGAAIGFSEGSARFNRYGGKSEGQALGLSLYGRQGQDTGVYVAGRLGFEHINSKVKRDIVLGSDTQKLESKRRDNLLSAYAETGHVFDVNGTRITPFVGVSLDSLNRGKIAEGGHAFGLQAKSKTYNQTAGILGLRLQSAAFDWAGGSTTFNSYAAYRYGSKTNLDFNAGFTGAPNAAFTVKGIGMQQHTGWLGVGVQTAATANVSWFANYNLQVGRGGVNNQVVSAGMRYAF